MKFTHPIKEDKHRNENPATSNNKKKISLDKTGNQAFKIVFFFFYIFYIVIPFFQFLMYLLHKIYAETLLNHYQLLHWIWIMSMLGCTEELVLSVPYFLCSLSFTQQ